MLETEGAVGVGAEGETGVTSGETTGVEGAVGTVGSTAVDADPIMLVKISRYECTCPTPTLVLRKNTKNPTTRKRRIKTAGTILTG